MVIDKTTRLRIRRVYRRRQKQVGAVASAADTHFDKNFVGRLDRLLDVQRFVFGWVFLVIALTVMVVFQTVGLNQYYLKRGAIAGGVLNEGMVGSLSNINPIYAGGQVDSSLSRLVFAGLLRYNDEGALAGDLASSYSIDESGRVYTVSLRPNLVWHDGEPLTSKDVVFTYRTIQNADAKSPLFSSWQSIKVTAPNPDTVVFRLPNALTAFPTGLTTGIIPEHILHTVPATQLRTNSFNTTQPVGAGPFKWSALQLGSTIDGNNATATISLKQFNRYQGGTPMLDGLTVHVYDTEAKALLAFKKHSIETIAGLRQLPPEIEKDKNNHVYRFSLAAANMIFLKTSEGILSETALRQALVRATNQPAIIKAIGGHVKPVREPLLKGQLGYDKVYEQATYNPTAAATILDQAGWTKDKTGNRSKNGVRLKVPVVAEENQDNHTVLSEIAKTWQDVGITLEPSYQPQSDFQSTVETHQYSGLLYGITIGMDPDVFVYWDSTQIDPRSANRLNFSEYKSAAADSALESGRTRQDPLVRTLKYKTFLKVWQEDAPAIGLYQPNVLYVTRGPIAGLNERTIVADADRYDTVTRWSIKTGNIPL